MWKNHCLWPVFLLLFTQWFSKINVHAVCWWHASVQIVWLGWLSVFYFVCWKCVSNVKTWMISNKLQMNEDKTEVLLVTAKRVVNLHHLLEFMNINGTCVKFNHSTIQLFFVLKSVYPMSKPGWCLISFKWMKTRQMSYLLLLNELLTCNIFQNSWMVMVLVLNSALQLGTCMLFSANIL